MPKSDITRRGFLAGATAAAALSSDAAARPKFLRGGKATPGAPPGSPLQITLTFPNSTTATFSQSEATDIGTYNGPFVHQRCFRQYGSGYGDVRDDLVVYFRPDVDGQRDEVIVELGSLTAFPGGGASPHLISGREPSHIIGGYTATITGGNIQSPVTVEVPSYQGHWFHTRWRWQSAQRPIVRTYQNLLDMKAIFPFSYDYVFFDTGHVVVPWEGPLGAGPLHRYMPGVGGYPDIGFINDWLAEWLITGSSDAEVNWRAAAEATGSLNIWCRDIATDSLINADTHKYVALQVQTSNPAHYLPHLDNSDPEGWNITIDTSHLPSLAVIPWLLTDDPYFLEGAQAVATYVIIINNSIRWNEQLPLLTQRVETRSWAWASREVFQQAAFAPDSPPSWILPRSYWRNKVIPDQLTYWNYYLANTQSPSTTYFKLFPVTAWWQAFQVYFMTSVVAWIKWSGEFPEFDDCIDYALSPVLMVNNQVGCSPGNNINEYGWDRREPMPYYMPIYDAKLIPNHVNESWMDYSIPYSVNTPISYGELLPYYKIIGPDMYGANWVPYDEWPADRVCFDRAYIQMWRGIMAFLDHLGYPTARASHDWLYNQMVVRVISGDNNYQWAIPPTSP